MNRASLAALASVAALAVAGCGSDDESATGGAASGGDDGGSMRIGALFLDAQGFYGGVRAGFEDAAKAANVDLKLQSKNSAADASAENSFLNTLVSSRVDAIIVSATSETASVPAIRQASQEGIPVVCYNTCVEEQALQEYVYAYALGDPVEFGAKIGDAAGKYFKKEGIDNPQIAIINCEFVEVCKQRRQGFEEALKRQVPGARIVANQRGETLDKAVPVAQNVLNAHPDIDAFWGEAGGASEGAVKAVQASGKTGDVVVFGSDMTTELAKALADNTILKADVDISGKEMGRTAFELVEKAKAGEQLSDKIVPVQVDLYDKAEQGTQWLEAHPDGLP
jgi:ABC-type sugar transport system substrate-binding protein